MIPGLGNTAIGEFPRSDSPASSAIVPALIERARVIDVNIADYTLICRTEKSQKPKFDIPWMSPYCNRAQGEGINFMPEVGSICWVCTPSETSQPSDDISFVIGWTMPHEEGKYRAGRPLLNPGDLHLSTRDGNFMILRRGGIVQIGATPVCQRIFLPIRNIIQDIAENYELHTPAGDLTWTVARADEDSEGHQKCLFQLDAREFADDPNPTQEKPPLARLKIGSHGDGDDTMLTLITCDKGGGSKKVTLTIDKSGNVNWTLVSGKFNLTVQDDITILTHSNMNLTADNDLSIKGKTVTAKGTTGLTLSSNTNASLKANAVLTLDGTSISIGEAQWPVLRASPDFLAAFAAMIAVVNNLAPGSVTPPTQFISRKVTI